MPEPKTSAADFVGDYKASGTMAGVGSTLPIDVIRGDQTIARDRVALQHFQPRHVQALRESSRWSIARKISRSSSSRKSLQPSTAFAFTWYAPAGTSMRGA